MHVDHLLAEPVRDRVDELLAVQDALHVLVVEDVLDAGQPEGRTGDDDRLGHRRRRDCARSATAGSAAVPA